VAECGVRIKYEPVARDRRPNRYAEMDRLAHWCRIFDEEGVAPVEGGASAGNLSFRTPSGFVITATRTRLKSDIPWHGFVEVVRTDWLDWAVHYLGENPPSSDVFLHDSIYKARPDVNAVLHGHDPLVMERADALAREFDLVVTPEATEFGLREDAEKTAAALGSHPYVIRRGHGFVAVGRTLDEAGELAVRVHRAAAR
jgi:ribulose-5-phosphate 4-epimerase/fuculose-1-phosphate aldolase